MAQKGQQEATDDNEIVEPKSPEPGQGQGMIERVLNEHLTVASRHMDKQELEKAIDDYRAHGLPTDTYVMAEAYRRLDILNTKEKIKAATQSKDLETLKKFLNGLRDQERMLRDEAEKEGKPYNKEDGFSFFMERELMEAHKLLRDTSSREKRKSKAMQSNLVLDKNAMSEIRSYQNPPAGVHFIMKATYLLLGEDEDTTMDWVICAKMANPLGKYGLQRRLMKLDSKKCHPELVKRAKTILEMIALEEIVKASRGGACFYVYAWGVIQEFEKTTPLDNVTPATVDRQREILHRTVLDQKEMQSREKEKQFRKEKRKILVEPKLV